MRAREHRPSEISFDEQFYPARPRSFRRRQARPRATAADIQRLGPARAENPKYVDWRRRRSMLRSARATARHYSGTSAMHSYGSCRSLFGQRIGVGLPALVSLPGAVLVAAAP